MEISWDEQGIAFSAAAWYGTRRLDWDGAGRAQIGGLTFRREVCRTRERLFCRISVCNDGAAGVELEDVYPLVARDPDVGTPCMLYRNGRHKHDIPTVCTLGVTDEAFFDALQELSESGGEVYAKQGPVNTVVCEQMTVLKGRAALLLGFLQGTESLNSCRVLAEGPVVKELRMAYELDGMTLAPGKTWTGSWIMAGAAQDPFALISAYTRLYREANALPEKKKPKSVFCTWYFYGRGVTLPDVREDLEGCRGLPLDVFQVDDGWQKCYGDWTANGKFPEGMESLAAEISVAGLEPGIWTAPFLADFKSGLPEEWLLRTGCGAPLRFPMDGKEYHVLDVSQERVCAFITAFMKQLRDWGFTYHKLDFTRAVMMADDLVYKDASCNRAKAYRRGLEAVRRGIGDGMMLVCGGLYDAAAGLADAQRTGSDVMGTWNAAHPPYPVKQAALRFWQNQFWNNDPDALMLRRRTEAFRGDPLSLGTLTDAEAKLSVLNQYLAGGMVCFSERMADADADRMALLSCVVPPLGTAAVPRDLFCSGGRYPAVFDTNYGGWHTAALVNWYDKEMELEVKLPDLLGEKGQEQWMLLEYFSGDVLKLGGKETLRVRLAPQEFKLYRAAPLRRTMLLGTNGHFSMGGAEISGLRETKNEISFQLNWNWDRPLRIWYLIDGTVCMAQAGGRYRGPVKLEKKGGMTV